MAETNRLPDLQNGEQLIYKTRQHVLVPLSQFLSGLALVGLLVAAGLAARAFGDQRVFYLPASQVILGSTSMISLFVVANLGWGYMQWRAGCYAITDQRLLQISGVLQPQVSAVPLDQVRAIQIEQAWLGRMAGFSNLSIDTVNHTAELVLEYVPQPHQMQQAFLEARQQMQRGYGYLDTMPPLPEPGVSVPVGGDVQHTLNELAHLRDRGILSLAEFEARKRELLNRPHPQ